MLFTDRPATDLCMETASLSGGTSTLHDHQKNGCSRPTTCNDQILRGWNDARGSDEMKGKMQERKADTKTSKETSIYMRAIRDIEYRKKVYLALV